MNTTMPLYQAPIEFGNDPENLVAYWDAAYDGYDAKDYRKCVLNTINYINPGVLADKDLNSDIEITQNHGSAVIRIKITDKEFTVTAPFLKIHNANKVAIMRRVAEVNFSSLTLPQIRYKDDALWFYFKTSLDLCNPRKVYDVIREICLYADDYDDEFIEKYKAEYYTPPNITQLEEEKKERVWQSFRAIAEQYEKYLQEFEKERWLGSVWDIMAISMLNLANMPYVHGTLRTELEQAISTHYNGDLDGNYRIDKAKSFLNELFKDTSKEQFLENVYLADTFVSVKGRSSIQILMTVCNDAKDYIVKDINEGNTFSAAYAMQRFFIKLLYDYNLDGKHQDVILETLGKAGGKECNEAAKDLWVTFQGFLNGAIEGGPRKKGFFAKLFG